MGEWQSVDVSALIGAINAHYTSGTFKVGVDPLNRLHIIPHSQTFSGGVNPVQDTARITDLPRLMKRGGYRRDVLVWIEPPDETLFNEVEVIDMLDESQRAAPVVVRTEATQVGSTAVEGDDVAFLIGEIKKLKEENQALTAQLDSDRDRELQYQTHVSQLNGRLHRLTDQLLCLDTFFKSLYAEAGGDVMSLPEDTVERAEAIAEFLLSQLE